jgi:outer membrane protein TolC
MNQHELQAHLVDQIGDIKEMVEDMRTSALTQREVRDAMAEGLMAAISREDFWPTLGAGMQAQATKQAGGWLVSGIKAALSKVFLFLLLGMLVYLVGGWSGLVALFKAGGHS